MWYNYHNICSAIYGGIGGKMDFFNAIFDGLVGLSEKLPAIGIDSFYIVVAVALGGVAIVVGLTFFASEAYKMKRAAGKVLSYLENEDVINDDNVAEFTSSCFGTKAPAVMRDAWVSYLGVRFGYPSEVVSESAVFDKQVKRPDSVRANVFIAVALVLTALFAFWGLGAMGTAEVGVVLCLGLLIGAVGYLVLWLVARSEYAAARKKFAAMQDELDAKVNLQAERDYATDASPLMQVAAIMDGIVARNTAKPAPTEEEVRAAAEAKQAAAHAGDEDGTAAPAEAAEEKEQEKEEFVPAEESTEEQPAEEPAEEPDSAAAEADGDTDGESPADDAETADPAKTPISAEEAEEAAEKEPFRTEEGNEGRGGSADDIENNDEDEENMFGRKKKKLQNEELTARGYENLVVDSELLPDDDGDGAEMAQLVAAPASAPASAPAPVQPYAQQPAMARGSMPDSLEGLNIAARPTADASVTVSLEPEVIYVEEDLDEGDEDVKPPRLAKLPHLVDYVLTMNISRSMKLRVAMLMLQAYNVFKNSPENKAIVIQCLTKVMKVLMAEHAAAQAARAAAAQQEAAQAAADTAAE